MENKVQSSNPVVFKWSIIYSITSIVITYAFQFLNVDQSSSAKYLGFIPFIAFMFLAQKEYKDQLGGYLSFGQAFLTGFKYTLIVSVILAIFTYIYFTYLSPQIYDQILAAARDKMAEQGRTSDQMDMAVKFMTVPIITVGVVISDLFFGAIFALIGAAIFNKTRPPFDINDETTYVDPAV
jgi:hypothetical protein